MKKSDCVVRMKWADLSEQIDQASARVDASRKKKREEVPATRAGRETVTTELAKQSNGTDTANSH
jgi:hypothetical protein